jgi:glyoxylase-like metal-dependent hydrolase (beta-lactamase superfamily II)
VLPATLVAVMMASALVKLGTRLRDNRSCDRGAALADPDCYSESQRAFFAAAMEAGRATPPSAVFLSSKEGTLHYLSGRRAVRELEAVRLDAPRLRSYLKLHGAEFILLSHTHLDQWTLARPLRDLCPSLEVVRVFDAHTALLRLVPGAARDGGRAGCAAIRRFAAAPW